MPSTRPLFARGIAPSIGALLALSLLVGSLIVAGCGDSEGDAGGEGGDAATVVRTVRSGELELILEIPTDGLGGGLTAQDITVTPIEVDPETVEDGEPVAAFRLEPDGAVFDEPIRAIVHLPDLETEVRVVLSAEEPGGELEPDGELLEVVGTRLDLEQGGVAMAFEIPHFSKAEVVFLDKGSEPTRVTILDRPRSEYAVGESFDVRVRVDSGYSNWTEISFKPDWIRRERRSTLRDQPWTGEVTWRTGAPDDTNIVEALHDLLSWSDDESRPRNDPPLTPERTKTPLTGPDGFTGVFATQTFTCVKPGDWTIDIHAAVKSPAQNVITETGYDRAGVYPYERKSGAWPEGPDGNYDRLVGRCVALETPTPDPTSTSTVEPSVTPTSEPTPSGTPEGSATPGEDDGPPPVSTPPPGAVAAELGDDVPAGKVLVFLLDGVFFDPTGLSTIDAHVPFCSYRHVHGGPIKSLAPQSDGSTLERSEHLGECGFGPPNFYIVDDPR